MFIDLQKQRIMCAFPPDALHPSSKGHVPFLYPSSSKIVSIWDWICSIVIMGIRVVIPCSRSFPLGRFVIHLYSICTTHPCLNVLKLSGLRSQHLCIPSGTAKDLNGRPRMVSVVAGRSSQKLVLCTWILNERVSSQRIWISLASKRMKYVIPSTPSSVL